MNPRRDPSNSEKGRKKEKGRKRGVTSHSLHRNARSVLNIRIRYSLRLCCWTTFAGKVNEMDISGSESTEEKYTWLESSDERRRKGNGLLERWSAGEGKSESTGNREKGLVAAGTTCIYTDVRRRRTRGTRRNRAKWDVRGMYRNHQDRSKVRRCPCADFKYRQNSRHLPQRVDTANACTWSRDDDETRVQMRHRARLPSGQIEKGATIRSGGWRFSFE